MEVNKIFGAVLVAGIAFVGLGLISDGLVHPAKLAKSAIEIKIPEAATQVAAGPPPVPSILPLLVKADIGPGEALTKKVCIACHNFNAGGGAKVGPALYGVVGRPQASSPGYTYSSALKSHTGKWTYEELNKWLLKPAAYAPGTKMAYAGVENDQIRADLIDYLRTLSPTPEPLPTAAEAEAAAKATSAAPAKSAAAAPAANALPPLMPLLAKAVPADGQALTRKICIACHNFNEGGGAKVGPALWGVVGRPEASSPGYTYSTALKGHGGVWTYEELNKWLAKPAAYAPGTKMAYAGISNAQTRADVIAYLRGLSHDPLPLPGAAAPAPVPTHASLSVPAPAVSSARAAGPAAKPATPAAITTPAPAVSAAKAAAPAAPAKPVSVTTPAPAVNAAKDAAAPAKPAAITTPAPAVSAAKAAAPAAPSTPASIATPAPAANAAKDAAAPAKPAAAPAPNAPSAAPTTDAPKAGSQAQPN